MRAIGYKNFTAEWTERSIAFFLDGRKTNEFDNHVIHEEMYVLANLSLGSHDPKWVPDPDQTTAFPSFVEIDYIRIGAYASS